MASPNPRATGNGAELHEQAHTEHSEFGQDVLNSISAISQPVEMLDLNSSKPTPHDRIEEAHLDAPRNTADTINANEISPAVQGAGATTRISEDESAIGPATERPHANIEASPLSGPQLVITLLLHATDTRHPYIINGKYLRKRNVQVADEDPVNLTVYNLKDLIWRDWREDWETRPASPASIRLIHMGRMLDDKAYLKDSRFSTGESPHVVHMSVKPSEVIDEEDAKIAKGTTRDRDETERRSGCRCIVM